MFEELHSLLVSRDLALDAVVSKASACSLSSCSRIA